MHSCPHFLHSRHNPQETDSLPPERRKLKKEPSENIKRPETHQGFRSFQVCRY